MKTLPEQVHDLSASIDRCQIATQELDIALDRLGRRLKIFVVTLWTIAGIAFAGAAYLYYHLP